MAQTFSEWHRGNGGGSYADYQQPGDPVVAGIVSKLYGDDPADTPRWTREEISALVNRGTSLVTDDSKVHLSDRDADLVNLIVNAAVSMFDDEPPATLDEVIERNWQPEPECTVCGGELERSEQEPQAGYLHADDTDDDHVPVLRPAGSIVRGWVNGDY